MVARLRYTKGSAVVEDHGGNAHIYISHGSYPFFTDDQDHGGVVIERADVQDVADCLRSFAMNKRGNVGLVEGVRVEWDEV